MTFIVSQRAIVADAPAAITFILGDVAWVKRWRGWIADDAVLLVPPHFAHEVANGLLRSARIGANATLSALDDLFRVRFEIADRGLSGLQSTVRLADQHGLTVYDAAYLDLAIDVAGELATLDVALRKAATAEGVAVI